MFDFQWSTRDHLSSFPYHRYVALFIIGSTNQTDSENDKTLLAVYGLSRSHSSPRARWMALTSSPTTVRIGPAPIEVDDLIVKTSMIRCSMRFVLCCLFTIESSLARRQVQCADAIVTRFSPPFSRNVGMPIGNRLITRRLIVLFRWAKGRVVVSRRAFDTANQEETAGIIGA